MGASQSLPNFIYLKSKVTQTWSQSSCMMSHLHRVLCDKQGKLRAFVLTTCNRDRKCCWSLGFYFCSIGLPHPQWNLISPKVSLGIAQ